MAIVRPTFQDMIHTNGFHTYYELFIDHTTSDCCKKWFSTDEIMNYLFKQFLRDQYIPYHLYDMDTISNRCDSCFMRDSCMHCKSRNIEHKSFIECRENQYQTVNQVLSHLIVCDSVPDCLVTMIINDRKKNNLDENNIHTITPYLCNLITQYCNLTSLDEKDHKTILDHKYSKICIFCK